MNIVQIVFSPTGGTQRVTDILTAGLQERMANLDCNEKQEAWAAVSVSVKKFDLADPERNGETLAINIEDLVIIAMPSFAGRVPGLAAQKLALIQGRGAKCVLVCVYGNRAYEDTLVEMSDLAEQCGFQVLAAVAAIAEHSIMHQYAAGRPDLEDRAVLMEFAGQIVQKVSSIGVSKKAAQSNSPEPGAGIIIPGNRPYKKASAASIVPTTEAGCIECGRCGLACPAQAISMEDFKTTDAAKCISCMRCVEECPMSARVIDSRKVAMLAERLKDACSVRKENQLFL